MIKIAIYGFGRMGKEILRQCMQDGLKVVAVVDADESPFLGKDAGTLAGLEPIGVKVTAARDMKATLDKTRPDVALDYTSADACKRNALLTSEKGVDLVIGTTGLDEKDLGDIRAAIKKNKTGAVISPNMSVGVNVLWKIAEIATSFLKDYDIEIIEKHHRFKKDAPSGTAIKTAEVIAKALERDLAECAVYGRKGLKERSPKEIGIHAVRAGDIVGEHTIIYGTLGERMEITHIAQSRAALAKGAVDAARYVKGKKGVYGMDDVLGLKKK